MEVGSAPPIWTAQPSKLRLLCPLRNRNCFAASLAR
jgi:hypothetical protein